MQQVGGSIGTALLVDARRERRRPATCTATRRGSSPSRTRRWQATRPRSGGRPGSFFLLGAILCGALLRAVDR